MNRTDFQELADVRIEEAKTLLDDGKWDGAYYLAGYAVECALKACIAKLTNLHDFPPDKKFVQDCYTHNIETLVFLAGVQAQRNVDAAANHNLHNNWDVVKDWSEASRYDRKSEAEARALYNAITDTANGVLSWIKVRW